MSAILTEEETKKIEEKVEEKVDQIDETDLTGKTSSIADSPKADEESEVKEVELLELVVETETKKEHTPLVADSTPELPLENEEKVVKKEKEPVVYEIQKIVGHKLSKGNVTRYEIKWKGYPAEENTLEKAAAIHADVPELCIEYWNSINIARPYNVPEQPKAVKVEVIIDEEQGYDARKRPILEEEEEGVRRKRVKKEDLPSFLKEYKVTEDYPTEETDWDNEIKSFCVQATPMKPGDIQAYVHWNNGKKTIHDMKTLHEKIPEKLFAYYEDRLHFV